MVTILDVKLRKIIEMAGLAEMTTASTRPLRQLPPLKNARAGSAEDWFLQKPRRALVPYELPLGNECNLSHEVGVYDKKEGMKNLGLVCALLEGA